MLINCHVKLDSHYYNGPDVTLFTCMLMYEETHMELP